MKARVGVRAGLPSVVLLALCGALIANAQDRSYSPPARAEHPTRIYWGDTHLHTSNSLDARAFGVALGVEDAYRFARGDEVVATHGQPAKLSRPLDWLVVTDHSDAIGAVNELVRGNPELLADSQLRDLHERMQRGRDAAAAVGIELVLMLGDGQLPEALMSRELMQTVWDRYVETADRYNEPGRFSAIIGYEWTPTQAGDKLHRNVLYRGGADRARRVLPYTATESVNPQDLWKWMQRYEDETGGRVLALAHNGNLSNGQMFPVETNPNSGNPIGADYVKTRSRWEVLYEVTQIKGDSEAHPYLSPNDEFADFETWDRGNVTLQHAKTPDMLQYEYAREALKNGLKLERRLGTNPYQFGMVGSTDSHTALTTAEEDNFFGKHSGNEPDAGRLNRPMVQFGDRKFDGWEVSAAGYAAVWATENTREAIWDAMLRREVYATTGPRMTVRFFGGWNFSAEDASLQKVAGAGYEKGVPMGGTLEKSPSATAPTFLFAALKDPYSGNLDRVQIVKGWLDAGGATREQVYNAAWGDAHRRKLKRSGELRPVGNTVDVANATWTNSIGDAELVGFWRDPDFDASQPAFYYARVIEIPTPRWTAYDAKHFGLEAPSEAPMTIQERAYTSPIWYSPTN